MSSAGEAPPVAEGKAGSVVTLVGKHFHNKPGGAQGLDYVKQTLMDKLKNGSVMLPDSKGVPKSVKISELGITVRIASGGGPAPR